MKRLIAVILVVVLSVSLLASAAFAAYDPQVDYTSVMVSAAVSGDYQMGLEAEQARNEKIDALGLGIVKISFDDLLLLSKIMYAEAGSEWLSDEWKMCVGEVVLNRVASPEFPNTIEEVLKQPGQYYGSNSSYFNRLLPSERCVLGAIRLLNGERLMDEAVVFQANFKQGGGTHTAFFDDLLGWTYFCFSSKTHLYEDDAGVAEAAAPPAEQTPAVEAVEIDENIRFDEFVKELIPIAE